MSLCFAIYLIGILDNLKTALAVASVFLGIGTIVLAIITGVALNDLGKQPFASAPRLIKAGFISLAATVFLAVALPSSRTVAAMYVVPAIVENRNIQELAGNSVDALRLLVKNWVTELAKDEKR